MKKFIYILIIICITLISLISSIYPSIKIKSEPNSYELTGETQKTEDINNSEDKNSNNDMRDTQDAKNADINDKSEEVAAVNTTIKSTILLVNKNTKISKTYMPKKLKTPKVRFISYASSKVKRMDEEAANALESLFSSSKKEGINLLAVSGYRDYNYQQKLYNDKIRNSGRAETEKYVAKPGTSEHQTGLAMDVLSNEYTTLDEGFENTAAYKWLEKNCSKYGYIIRYPKGKEDITQYNYEPWHIRYVGVNAAKEIMDNNLTLEEYLNSPH